MAQRADLRQRIRQALTREYPDPRFVNYLGSEQHKRDADKAIHFGAIIGGSAIVMGVVGFALFAIFNVH